MAPQHCHQILHVRWLRDVVGGPGLQALSRSPMQQMLGVGVVDTTTGVSLKHRQIGGSRRTGCDAQSSGSPTDRSVVVSKNVYMERRPTPFCDYSGSTHMASSYAYTSGNATVVCATLRLADNRYCGNVVAVVTTPDGRRKIHERRCPGCDHTLADALTRARAMAEAHYPATPQRQQQPATATARLASAFRMAEISGRW